MTTTRAIETLQSEGYTVDSAGVRLFSVSKEGKTQILGETGIVELAREMEGE